MSMRNFIGIIGGLLVEGFEDETEILVENEVPEENPLLQENYVQIKIDENEFDASWDGELDSGSADRLAEIITESQDYEVYYLNSMTFVFKNQALAAVRSLARNP